MRDCVLVHGGWGGSWCWDEVVPLLSGVVGRVFVPTLAGLAERGDETGVEMNTHVTDIVRLLDDNDVRDAVLVGHSYGGLPITGAAHHRPGRIHCLLYLDALVPEDGQSCADVLGPGFVARAREESERAGTPETVPWLFGIEDILGSGPEAEQVGARMTPHPIGTLFGQVGASGTVGLRKVYAYCTGAADLGMTTGFAQNARNDPDWEYCEIAAPHDALHADPESVARLVTRLATS